MKIDWILIFSSIFIFEQPECLRSDADPILNYGFIEVRALSLILIFFDLFWFLFFSVLPTSRVVPPHCTLLVPKAMKRL
jgi:hypothetical protein